MNVRTLFALSLTLLFGCAREAPIRPMGGQVCRNVSMPTILELEGRALVLNGMAVREASIFQVDVYVGGLYLEQPTRDVGAFLESEQHKRLVLHFVHGVGRSDVVRAFRWGLRTNVGDEQSRFEQDIAQLEQMLVGVRNGDEVTFDYVPSRGITMLVNGHPRGRLENEAFARPFFMVFVGPHGTNNHLRDGLVGGICND